jgi:hypothetical protein
MMRSLVLAAMLTLVPSIAFADSPGWITGCLYSHSAYDDPIKFPGQRGASHLHDFFGSKTTNFASTLNSMLDSPTTCGTKEDTSAYWMPALFRNGVKISPSGAWSSTAVRQKFYYRDDHYSPSTVVEPFPPDFRMIQGFHDATSVANANAHGARWGSKMWWGCEDNSVGGKPTMPVDCKTGIMTLHITFPSCWDGVMVQGDAIAAGHVKYPAGMKCPAGFTRALPILIERFEYPVGSSSSGIAFSSGPAYTAHADFWNTWDQDKLTSLVNNCLNLNRNCGTDP